MKRILILSIALLFVSGLAMAAISWTGDMQYGTSIWVSPYPGALNTDVRPAYYARLRLYAGITVSDFVKGMAQFRVTQSLNAGETGGDGANGDQWNLKTIRWDEVNVKLDLLGFFAIKDAPLTISIGVGSASSYSNLKPYRVDHQDILKRVGGGTASGSSATTKATSIAGMEHVFLDRTMGVFVEINLMKMLIFKFGQRLWNEAWTVGSYGLQMGLPITWLEVDFLMDFLTLEASVLFSSQYAETLAMAANFGAGVKLNNLVPGLLNLSGGIGACATNLLAENDAAGEWQSDIWLVAGVLVELNFAGMTSKTSSGISMKIDPNAISDQTFVINTISVAEEFWITQFMGIEVGTIMTLSPFAPGLIENVEILTLWKLGGIEARLGWVIVPDIMMSKTTYTNNGDWWYAANIYDKSGIDAPFAADRARGGFVFQMKAKF